MALSDLVRQARIQHHTLSTTFTGLMVSARRQVAIPHYWLGKHAPVLGYHLSSFANLNQRARQGPRPHRHGGSILSQCEYQKRHAAKLAGASPFQTVAR